MSDTSDTYASRLASLCAGLVKQAEVVESLVEDVVESVFTQDAALARSIGPKDEEIDRVDVRIERGAVELLVSALAHGGSACGFTEREVRLILTIVKVNNEYERIADLAVNIADQIDSFLDLPEPMPARFRVMANSVIGMILSTTRALDAMDPNLARSVLLSYDATTAFQCELMRDVEKRVASGTNSVEYALAAQVVVASLARMADHCTNVSEQVIYVSSGKIVRHSPQGWSEPMEPQGA